MKPLIVLILAGLCSAIAAAPAGASAEQLSAVHKVYLLPMAGGLDQYLAQQLTATDVFTVVADPKQADAVWSERVDAAFLSKMDELYPRPKPPEPKGSKDSKEAGKKETDIEMKGSTPPTRAPLRSRGNVFLIGVTSRQVIWSTYLSPQDRSSRGLHRAARDIVKQLQKDLKGGAAKE
ncbi:MAG: hypothetical protein HY236_02025 [Acidobacteria bacterium]|nr:hypothetical protein [Acidobacteriota bacterium]